MGPRLLVFALLLGLVIGVRAQLARPLDRPQMERDSAGTVTIRGARPPSIVLYTLDGENPTAKSNPYLSTIALRGGGVVKARVFSEDRKTWSEMTEAVFAPLSGRAAQPSTVVAVTQDRSWPRYDWAKRHERTVAAVKAAQPRIIFIGDSITHFFGGAQFDEYALRGAGTWEEFYAPRGAGNLGFGWDKTENVLWRLQHGAVDGISPRLIVVMIGTNNTPFVPAPDIVEGIKAIVAELNRRLPRARVLLLGIFPRGEKPGPQREKIAAVNRGIAALGGHPRVTYLDIGEKFLSSEGLISKDIMPDFLHPNERGYRIWAEAIEPTVKRLLAGDVE